MDEMPTTAAQQSQDEVCARLVLLRAPFASLPRTALVGRARRATLTPVLRLQAMQCEPGEVTVLREQVASKDTEIAEFRARVAELEREAAERAAGSDAENDPPDETPRRRRKRKQLMAQRKRRHAKAEARAAGGSGYAAHDGGTVTGEPSGEGCAAASEDTTTNAAGRSAELEEALEQMALEVVEQERNVTELKQRLELEQQQVKDLRGKLAAKAAAEAAREARVTAALEEADAEAQEAAACWRHELADRRAAAAAEADRSEAEVEAARQEAEAEAWAADASARRQAFMAASEAAAALEVIKAMTAEVVLEAAAAVAEESLGFWHDPANVAYLAQLQQNVAQWEAGKARREAERQGTSAPTPQHSSVDWQSRPVRKPGPPKDFMWDEKAQVYRLTVVPRAANSKRL